MFQIDIYQVRNYLLSKIASELTISSAMSYLPLHLNDLS